MGFPMGELSRLFDCFGEGMGVIDAQANCTSALTSILNSPSTDYWPPKRVGRTEIISERVHGESNACPQGNPLATWLLPLGCMAIGGKGRFV